MPISYPPSGEVVGAGRAARRRPLVNGVLAVPSCRWLLVLGSGAAVVSLAGWFAIVVTGRLPGRLGDYLVAVLRYRRRVAAFLFALTASHPGLRVVAGYVDPGDCPAVLSSARVTYLALPATASHSLNRSIDGTTATLPAGKVTSRPAPTHRGRPAEDATISSPGRVQAGPRPQARLSRPHPGGRRPHPRQFRARPHSPARHLPATSSLNPGHRLAGPSSHQRQSSGTTPAVPESGKGPRQCPSQHQHNRRGTRRHGTPPGAQPAG